MSMELFLKPIYSDANLQHYYRMEGLTDEINSLTLTNENSVAFNAAKFNNGADLGASNTDKRLVTASATQVALLGAFSFSLWVKLQTEVGAGGVYLLAMDTIVNGEGHNYNFIYYYESGGVYSLQFAGYGGSGNTNVVYAVGALGTTNYTHLVGTYSGGETGTQKLYVNGVQQGGDVTQTTTGAPLSQTGGFSVGANTAGVQYSSAIIDDVAYFDRVLTQGEITSIYSITDKVFTETISISDSISKKVIKTFSEVITLVDSSTQLRVVSKTLTETITIVDSLVKSISKVFTNTLTITDSLLKTLSKIFTETITLVETFIKAQGKILLETVTITDSLVKAVSKVFTNTVSIADSLLKSIGRTFSDTLTITDSKIVGYIKTFTETIKIKDTLRKWLNGLLYTIWGKTAKPTATYTKDPKPTATWTKEAKPTTIWTKEEKPEP